MSNTLIALGILIAGAVALRVTHFIYCRIIAKPCPKCGERRLTELVGEWGDEAWHCAVCDYYWHSP